MFYLHHAPRLGGMQLYPKKNPKINESEKGKRKE
jgi:hypothetical protein